MYIHVFVFDNYKNQKPHLERDQSLSFVVIRDQFAILVGLSVFGGKLNLVCASSGDGDPPDGVCCAAKTWSLARTTNSTVKAFRSLPWFSFDGALSS